MVQSKQAHLFQFFVITLFLLYWHPIRANQVEHEIEFDYREGSEKGPEHWGDLEKEWATCKDGKLQSPVDLLEESATKLTPGLKDLKMSYKLSNATIKNEGHYIAIEWDGDAGSIQIDGTDYFLKQCHWHTPSEHSINGIRYDLELHMVHRSANPKMKNSVAVVAFLYKIGDPNIFLSKVNKDLSSLVDTEEIHLGVIDPKEIKWGSLNFYRYMGSLTTPACTEGVIWTVNERVITVSEQQLGLLKHPVYDYAVMNARPLQPLNDRDIKFYGRFSQSDGRAYRASTNALSPQQNNQTQSNAGAPHKSIHALSPQVNNQSPMSTLKFFPQLAACIFAYFLLTMSS